MEVPFHFRFFFRSIDSMFVLFRGTIRGWGDVKNAHDRSPLEREGEGGDPGNSRRNTVGGIGSGRLPAAAAMVPLTIPRW